MGNLQRHDLDDVAAKDRVVILVVSIRAVMDVGWNSAPGSNAGVILAVGALFSNKDPEDEAFGGGLVPMACGVVQKLDHNYSAYQVLCYPHRVTPLDIWAFRGGVDEGLAPVFRKDGVPPSTGKVPLPGFEPGSVERKSTILTARRQGHEGWTAEVESASPASQAGALAN